MKFARIKKRLLFTSTYFVVFYRLFSFFLKRILYYFPDLGLLFFIFKPSRIPIFSPYVLEQINGPYEYLDKIANNTLSGEIFLFGHHLVRLDLLENHIYNFPSEASFLSHSYPHYSNYYVQLYNTSDVKYCWDYGRLQWLIPVAISFYNSPSEQKISYILDTIKSFCKSAKYSHGIHWSCTMDVSFRALSLLSIFTYIHRSLSANDNKFFQKILYQHLSHILCNIELSFDNGNHFNSNLAALTHLLYFFKDVFISPFLLSCVRRISAKEFIKQFDDSGFNYEGSIPYLRLNADLFFFVFYPYILENVTLPTCVFNQFILIRNLLELLTDGLSISPPTIGDNDSASIFIPKSNSLADYLQTVAALDQLLNLFNAQSTHESLPSQYILDKSSSSSGICWIRLINGFDIYSNKNGFTLLKSSYINIYFFNTKPGLMGLGGHTHADYLSFLLFVNKFPVFVDPGTSTYSGDPIERDIYRSELFHNTPIRSVVVDDFSYHYSLWSIKSSVLTSPIDVASTLSSVTLTSSISKGHAYLSRSINISDSLISIFDFTSNCNLLGASFFLHPDISATIKDTHIASIFHKDFIRPILVIRINPHLGCILKSLYYYSPGYGQRIPSFVITIKYNKPLENTVVPITLVF